MAQDDGRVASCDSELRVPTWERTRIARGWQSAQSLEVAGFGKSFCNRSPQAASGKDMKPSLTSLLLALALAAALAPSLRAQDKPQAAPMKLKVGDMAPDFTLKYFDGAKVQDISLHEFRGKKNVIVAFFVFAFTGG